MDPREERLWDQIERVESEVKAKEKERRAAVDATLIANIDKEIQRLVQEQLVLRQQLSALHAQQAGLASAIPAASLLLR